MNMFARFDENPAMTLRVIKETKHYGRTDGQRENSIPPTNKVCGGGIKNGRFHYAQHICASCWQKDSKKLEHPECSSACPYTKL